MRNNVELRNEILARYNRQRRIREQRRRNLTSAVCSLCMVFVILITGSAYLSAAFGASLFVDFDEIIRNEPEKNPAPEGPILSDSDFEELGSSQSETSECETPSSPNEDEQTDALTVETKSQTNAGNSDTVLPAPETTKAPEWTMAPETTKAPEWTKAPESPSAEYQKDGAGFWRFLILGSAGACLTAACVFVYKALKKEK